MKVRDLILGAGLVLTGCEEQRPVAAERVDAATALDNRARCLITDLRRREIDGIINRETNSLSESLSWEAAHGQDSAHTASEISQINALRTAAHLAAIPTDFPRAAPSQNVATNIDHLQTANVIGALRGDVIAHERALLGERERLNVILANCTPLTAK